MLEELLNDKEFLIRLESIKDEKELQAFLREHGLFVSDEELLSLNLPKDEEIFEEDLESVAGGSVASTLKWIKGLISKSKGNNIGSSKGGHISNGRHTGKIGTGSGGGGGHSW